MFLDTVVPTDKRYILVSGNYQSGISVLDFSNPSAAKEIASAVAGAKKLGHMNPQTQETSFPRKSG